MKLKIYFTFTSRRELHNFRIASSLPEFKRSYFRIVKNSQLELWGNNDKFHIELDFPDSLYKNESSLNIKNLLESPNGRAAIKVMLGFIAQGLFEEALDQLFTIKEAVELLKDQIENKTDNPGLLKPLFIKS